MEQRATAFHIALAGFASLVFAMGVGRFAFTPLLPMMQDEGLLDVESGGVLASVHFVGYAMGALLAGRLTSSPKAVLVGALAATGVATGAMGLSASPAVWLIARWCAGVSSALALVVVSSHFLNHLTALGRPDLSGWVFAGVGSGIAVAGLGTLWMMHTGAPSVAGWQVFGLATLAATAAVYGLAGAAPAIENAPPRTHSRDAARLNWRIILPYGTMGAGYIIPATYLPIMGQQAISSPLVIFAILATSANTSSAAGAAETTMNAAEKW